VTNRKDDIPSNAKVSFQRGLRFLRLMFVVSFRFLSGSSITLTYGSDVPDMSLAASSDALMMRKLSVSVCNHSDSNHVYAITTIIITCVHASNCRPEKTEPCTLLDGGWHLRTAFCIYFHSQFLPRCMECRRGLAMGILSVCLSVTRVHCDKTEERSVQISIPYERTFILVFWEEEWLVAGDPFYLKFWVNRPPLQRNRRFSTNNRS